MITAFFRLIKCQINNLAFWKSLHKKLRLITAKCFNYHQYNNTVLHNAIHGDCGKWSRSWRSTNTTAGKYGSQQRMLDAIIICCVCVSIAVMHFCTLKILVLMYPHFTVGSRFWYYCQEPVVRRIDPSLLLNSSFYSNYGSFNIS